MEQNNSQTEQAQQLREQKIEQLKEDYENDWWKAGAVDEFNIKNKLLRVGCRPLKRKYLACTKSVDMDYETYGQCKRLREQLDECYTALQLIQIKQAQSKIEADSLQTVINKKIGQEQGSLLNETTFEEDNNFKANMNDHPIDSTVSVKSFEDQRMTQEEFNSIHNSHSQDRMERHDISENQPDQIPQFGGENEKSSLPKNTLYGESLRVENYKIEDYRSPKARELLSMAQQYRRFDITDVYMIIGVFIIGFVFAYVLSNYGKWKTQKIQEINKQFQGLKGEYEQVQKRLGKYIQWKYRVKIAEKVFYVLLLALGFMFYKSPSLMSYTFTEIPHLSIPFFTVVTMFFSLCGMWLERKEKDQEKRHVKLKEQLKDTKRLLLSHMDPIMVQTVKELVRKDMRREIEQMKNSDEGCSHKCKLMNEMHRKDLGRNKVIVNELIQFKWCDTCQKQQPAAAAQASLCQAGCGQKVYNRCLPLMKEYGEMESEIQLLKKQIQEINEASLKFSEFQKAKNQIEYQEMKQLSQTQRFIDNSFQAIQQNEGSVSGAKTMRNSQRLQ